MSTLEKFYYDNASVKNFAYATAFWGVVGMLVGLLASFQLIFPSLNFGMAETTFGRIRPLHTNAVIFCLRRERYFHGRLLLLAKITQNKNV